MIYEENETNREENNDRNGYLSNFECYHCMQRSLEKEQRNDSMSYILLDLRISEEKNNDMHYDVKPGFLPMTVIIDQSELNDDNVKI